MQITRATPLFGDNYDVGWIGFTRTAGAVSDAVQFGEHWARGTYPAVTHTFVVAGAGSCTEAHAGEGVNTAPLAKYFGEPTTKIYLRRPAPWNPAIGARIAAAAAKHIGDRYCMSLIVADGLDDSLIGHALNAMLNNFPKRLAARWLTRPGQEICSQLVGIALENQGEFQGRGVLSQAPELLQPQDIFNCEAIFDGTIYDLSCVPGADAT